MKELSWRIQIVSIHSGKHFYHTSHHTYVNSTHTERRVTCFPCSLFLVPLPTVLPFICLIALLFLF